MRYPGKHSRQERSAVRFSSWRHLEKGVWSQKGSACTPIVRAASPGLGWRPQERKPGSVRRGKGRVERSRGEVGSVCLYSSLGVGGFTETTWYNPLRWAHHQPHSHPCLGPEQSRRPRLGSSEAPGTGAAPGNLGFELTPVLAVVRGCPPGGGRGRGLPGCWVRSDPTRVGAVGPQMGHRFPLQRKGTFLCEFFFFFKHKYLTVVENLGNAKQRKRK